MKISKIIFAVATVSIFSLTSCRDTKTQITDDHGHKHDSEGNYLETEKVDQEEFQVQKDTIEIKKETHSHDNDSDHQDHKKIN